MNKKRTLLLLTASAAGSLLYNILKPIKSTAPVIQNFELNKYLGQWFEIARLDFYWEKNLKNVVAKYCLNDNGTIKVVNQGQQLQTDKIKTSIGKAKLAKKANFGALKVSFFGPFYSGYNIIHIDDNYQYALVFGENLDYMWILSRTKEIPTAIKNKYLDCAKKSGYATDQLVWTIHD